MKEQKVEVIFFLSNGPNQIGVFRIKDKGKWVYNITQQPDRKTSKNGTPILRRDFKNLKAFKKVQINGDWDHDIDRVIEGLIAGHMGYHSDPTEIIEVYSLDNYVHQDYFDSVRKVAFGLIRTIEDIWGNYGLN